MHCHNGVTGRAVADLITKAIENDGLNMDHCRGWSWKHDRKIQWYCKTDPECS